VMQPFRGSALKAYHTQCLPDVSSDRLIELNGRVRIEMPDHRGSPSCDYVCLAALDSPNVDSVTVVTAGKRGRAEESAAFAFERARQNPTAGLFPNRPGQIVKEYSSFAPESRGRQVLTAAKAVEAHWAMRLAGRDRLREANPTTAEAADWVIRIESRTGVSKVRRVTILDASGAVRFRKSYNERYVPAAMFYFGFKIHGTISGASFHVGRQQMRFGEKTLQPESELLDAIKFEPPRCDADSITELRDLAVRALDNPNASKVQVDLARRYLALFFFDATQQDYPLIARIVADKRVKDIDQQIRNVFSKKKAPPEMKNAFAERIVMGHTSAELRGWLAEGLANMPPNAFAQPTAAHLEIWTTPELYRDAGPFISRTADVGAAQAIPLLQAALDTAVAIPVWQERRPLVEGIRMALIRLGPSGSAIASRVSKLFLLRPSPLMSNAGQADEWRFALARTGVAIEDLPYFPNQSTKMVQRISHVVAQKLIRYEKEHGVEPGR
ncbi:MAG: hypothetical protein AB8G99_09100, partial [Planctomycetaceae bacterium]